MGANLVTIFAKKGSKVDYNLHVYCYCFADSEATTLKIDNLFLRADNIISVLVPCQL